MTLETTKNGEAGSARPARGLSDLVASRPVGLFAGTKIASNLGWRPVEKLRAGDKVLTFDNGMQEVLELRRTAIFSTESGAAAELWPVVIPAGVLGNRDQVVLPAHQPVMLECDAVRDGQGDPFAVIPARALAGFCGIARRAPKMTRELITVIFAQDEVVYTGCGMLALCRRRARSETATTPQTSETYPVLNLKQSMDVLKSMDFKAQRIVQTGAYVFGATEVGLVA